MESISAIRTVPVGEDLTGEELRLSVLRGLETAFRVDKKVAAGEALVTGDWAILNADGELEGPESAGAAATYLVFAGTDRYDSAATGQATIFMNSSLIIKTSKFDPAPSYEPGMALTAKFQNSSTPYLTQAGAADAQVGRVIELGNGYLVLEVSKQTVPLS